MQLQSAIQQYGFNLSMVQAQSPTKMVPLPGSETKTSQESTDTVTISREGQDQSAKATAAEASAPESSSDIDLSKEEMAALTKLQARDKEVRAHEQAHLAAAGGYATSGASFTFQKGPDGNSYAVGGEVGIDMSKESDPSATIQKMRAVKRAALAPANPSSTDRQIAAQATAKETQARQELVEEQEEMLQSTAVNTNVPNETSSAQPQDSVADSSPAISALKAIAAYQHISAL